MPDSLSPLWSHLLSNVKIWWFLAGYEECPLPNRIWLQMHLQAWSPCITRDNLLHASLPLWSDFPFHHPFFLFFFYHPVFYYFSLFLLYFFHYYLSSLHFPLHHPFFILPIFPPPSSCQNLILPSKSNLMFLYSWKENPWIFPLFLPCLLKFYLLSFMGIK